MTYKMRSTSVTSASTRVGAAIAATMLSVAFVSDRPATAAEPWPSIAAETQKLHYSSWAKFCERDLPEAAWRLRQAGEHVPLVPGLIQGPLVPRLIPEPLCFTVADARTEAGQPIVAVALIEREGEGAAWVLTGHIGDRLDRRHG